MTKSELIEVVAQEANLTKGRAELVINTIFESMVEALQRGEGIEIRGFGSFTVREYKAYEGRNPRTGDPVHVAPKRLPFFKVGKDLRLRVNGQRIGPAPVKRTDPAKPAAPSPASAPPKPSVGPDPGMTEDVI
ncbi:MAG: integration host factor subunit beta [Myxococcales bacterium]|nr:integration host factor subunit beta [Myxococcales bacterium]